MSQLIPNGTYPITNVFSGFDLKHSGGSGTDIVIGQNDSTDAFKWTFVCKNASQNTYTITNKDNNLIAHVPDNSKANTNVKVNSTAQIFTISKVAGTNNIYNIYLGATLAYWSVDSTAENTPVVLSSSNASDHQQFKIVTGGSSGGSGGGPLSNGQYRLKNQAPNLNVRPQAGANSRIEPAIDDGSSNFQWQLTLTGTNLFTIKNVNNNLFVWIDSSANSGTAATMNTSAVSFTIVEVPGKTGIYTIQTTNYKYLGVGGSPSGVITGDISTPDAFQWAITF